MGDPDAIKTARVFYAQYAARTVRETISGRVGYVVGCDGPNVKVLTCGDELRTHVRHLMVL